MPEYITEIATEELLKDLDETKRDIETCKMAQLMGIKTYGDNESVAERLKANLEIKIRIEAELLRRQTEA